MRHVREADIVIWLVSEDATIPVCNEIREALSSNRRLWVVKLPTKQRDITTENLLAEVGNRAKWIEIDKYISLTEALQLTLEDELLTSA